MEQPSKMEKSGRQGVAGTRKRPKNSQRLMQGAALAAGAALTGNASAATIVVNSLLDTTATDGLCTLREALNNANSNSDTTGGDCVAGSGTDTIDLSALAGTITLGGTQLTISGSTTITGPGPSALTINANNTSRVFYIYNNSSTLNVTISGMTLTHGQIATGRGSVISNKGENVTLSNLTINTSVPHTGVVASINSAGNVLTIQNSTISGNTGGVGNGGAVYASGGNVTISGSTISGNAVSKGGGLFLKNITNPVSITNTTISNNTATANRGGGIFLYTVNSTVTISGSTISGNTTVNRGGGLFLYKVNAAVTISDSTISGNTAGSAGGALFLYRSTVGGPLTIQRSTISGNSGSSGRGGGLFLYRTNSAIKLENTTVSGNTASAGGGGLYLQGPFGGSHSLAINSSTFAFNTSNTGGNINGGSSASTISINNSIIAGGSAGTGPDIRNGSATITLNYSLLQATSGASFSGGHNITGVSPGLLALANNGGATQTHAFAASSPVVNAGDPTGAGLPTTDQRGLARISGGVVDMGAVELQSVAPAVPTQPVPTLPSLPPVPGVSTQPSVLDLFSGQGPAMTNCLQDAARVFFGPDAAFLGQMPNGNSKISQGGRLFSFYVIGATTVSSPTPSIGLGSSNALFVTTSCGTLTIIPAMFNLSEFGATLITMGFGAQVNPQGVITVVAGSNVYVGRPDYVALPGGVRGAGLAVGSDGLYRFTDSAGVVQVLRPAFLDTDGLAAQLPALLGAGTVTIQTDGSAWYNTFKGQLYALIPDLSLTPATGANAASLAWQDGPNHYQFRSNTLIYAQGFTALQR